MHKQLHALWALGSWYCLSFVWRALEHSLIRSQTRFGFGYALVVPSKILASMLYIMQRRIRKYCTGDKKRNIKRASHGTARARSFYRYKIVVLAQTITG